jgi:WD40 repeat protein
MSENTKTSNPAADGDRFPSLTALRIAHSEMLTLHRKWGNVPEMKAKIEQLINKGRATGALLDSEDDRWAAQSLLDYWNSLLYRAGQEPPDTTLVDFDPSLSPDLGIDKRIDLYSPTTLNSPSSISPQAPPIPLAQARPEPAQQVLVIPQQAPPKPAPQVLPIPPQVPPEPAPQAPPVPPAQVNKIIKFLFIPGTFLVITAYLLKSTTEFLFRPISPSISSEEINIRYSPNGNSILTIRKGTARLWDLQGKSLSVIGKEGGTLSAVFSPDSKLIATTELDENIKLWDYQGRKKVTLNGNKSLVTGVAFSPDGKYIAAASSDKSISLWNVQGTLLLERKDRETVVRLIFSPDGKSILTANKNGVVHRWNLSSQEPNLEI